MSENRPLLTAATAGVNTSDDDVGDGSLVGDKNTLQKKKKKT
jgi:hypothetical protein